jgi:hypothetical protein
MDGPPVDVAKHGDVVTLLADRHSSRREANDPKLVAAKEHALLAVIGDRPGLARASWSQW